MRRPMNFILAGNSRQFDNYCRTHNIPRREAVYVHDGQSLRGRVCGTLLLVGTWFTSRHADEIVRIAKHRGWAVVQGVKMFTILYDQGKEIRVGHRDGSAQLVPTPAGPAIYLDSDEFGYISTAEHSGFIMPRMLYPVATLRRFAYGWAEVSPLKNPDEPPTFKTPAEALAAVAAALGISQEILQADLGVPDYTEDPLDRHQLKTF